MSRLIHVFDSNEFQKKPEGVCSRRHIQIFGGALTIFMLGHKLHAFLSSADFFFN